MINVDIIGTGSYVPQNIMTNDDLSKIVDTNDEWISTRTGIKQRRISAAGEDTCEIALNASLSAIKDAHITPSDIDLIIVATTSPEYFVPSTACILQGKIGAKNAVCFDISAACSGFMYALSTGKNFIAAGEYNTALIVGAEVLSKITNWKDRGTCILFGDGAGAAIIRKSSNKGIISIKLGSKGDKYENLQCKTRSLINPYTKENKETEDLNITMNGREIFKFAVNVIQKAVKTILQQNNMDIEDIKYIVPHQANFRIIEFASKKSGIPIDKFYINLDKYGNTSGASIPIALDELNKKGMLKSGDKIILAAFGGGLTYGYSLVEWK